MTAVESISHGSRDTISPRLSRLNYLTIHVVKEKNLFNKKKRAFVVLFFYSN